MKRPSSFRSHASTRLALVAVLAVGACEGTLPPESPVPDTSARRPLLSAAVVSDPAGTPGRTAASLSGSAGATVAYVSLPPGTIPSAEQATLRNPHTGATATVSMVDGGFDPVAIQASAGDTLALDLTVTGSSGPLIYAIVVPPSRPPIVVRTDPPPKKRDVPLNAMMLIVFSEPIDVATLAGGAIQLLDGATPVVGQVQTTDAANLTVSFTASAPLRSEAEYQLLVTQAVRDLDDEPLETPVAVTFTTVPPVAVASVTVTPEGSTIEVGSQLQFTAVAQDAGGNVIEGRPFTWSTSDPSVASVSASGLVTAVAAGTATVVAEVDAAAGGVALTVQPRRPIGSATGIRFDRWWRYDPDRSPLNQDGRALVLTTDTTLKYGVETTDARGNVVLGVHINFAVSSGGGVLFPSADTTAYWQDECWYTANVCGFLSAFSSHRLGNGLGPQSVTATATGLPGAPQVTFTVIPVAAIVWYSDDDPLWRFSPAQVSLPVGAMVGWRLWYGTSEHNVTFEDNSEPPASSGTGGIHTRSFVAPGTYRYRCTLHSTGFDDSDGEIGSVIVF